jgi:hypothetical protein
VILLFIFKKNGLKVVENDLSHFLKKRLEPNL